MQFAGRFPNLPSTMNCWGGFINFWVGIASIQLPRACRSADELIREAYAVLYQGRGFSCSLSCIFITKCVTKTKRREDRGN